MCSLWQKSFSNLRGVTVVGKTLDAPGLVLPLVLLCSGMHACGASSVLCLVAVIIYQHHVASYCSCRRLMDCAGSVVIIAIRHELRGVRLPLDTPVGFFRSGSPPLRAWLLWVITVEATAGQYPKRYM